MSNIATLDPQPRPGNDLRSKKEIDKTPRAGMPAEASSPAVLVPPQQDSLLYTLVLMLTGASRCTAPPVKKISSCVPARDNADKKINEILTGEGSNPAPVPVRSASRSFASSRALPCHRRSP